MFEKNRTASAETAPLSMRTKLLVGVTATALALTFAARTTEQVVEANGCTIEPTNNPFDLATAPIANLIDMPLEGIHDSHDCDK